MDKIQKQRLRWTKASNGSFTVERLGHLKFDGWLVLKVYHVGALTLLWRHKSRQPPVTVRGSRNVAGFFSSYISATGLVLPSAFAINYALP